MKDLVVPLGVLSRYPLSVPTVVAALWEVYMHQVPPGQMYLTVPVEEFLERLGKSYNQAMLRELDDVLRTIYRLQKLGHTREYKDGVDTITIWLTPDIVKRVRAYQESLRPHA